MESTRWSGLLVFDVGWALFVGRPGENTLHSHQAIQVCVSAEAPLELHGDDAGPVEAYGVAIDSRVRHRIETRSSRAAFLYVDALSEGGRRLSASFGGAGVRVASEGELGPARRALKRLRAGDGWAESAPALRQRILSAFVGDAPELESRGDPRVEETIAFIGKSVSERRISAFELADRVCLSPSRLAVLFRRETGVAIRPFILWTRLQRAVESAGRGKSLTEAAHAAGFADSAHLARTFRRMFGTTLSASVGRLEIRTGRSPHG